MTPTKAILARCTDCSDRRADRVHCPSNGKHDERCPLWPFRLGHRPRGSSPLRAIRAYCLWCCETAPEVKVCESRDCPLYQYRLGKNPARAGKGNASNLASIKKRGLSGAPATGNGKDGSEAMVGQIQEEVMA